jgi:hypothetical protein
MIMLKLWLSPEFLEWNMGGLDPKVVSIRDENVIKSYDLWRHAQQRLNEVDDNGGTEENFDLGDVVKSLREVVENRQKMLETKFNLEDYIFPETEKLNIPLYKKLEYFGMIKTTILKDLIEIRNRVVHEQKYPLTRDKKRISELVDITWYFLRSTDSLFGRIFSGLIFYPPDFPYEEEDFIGTNFTDIDFSIENYLGCIFLNLMDYPQGFLRARDLPAKYLSLEERDEWFELNIENFNDYEDEEINHLIGLLADNNSDIEKREEEDKQRHIKINNKRIERARNCLQFDELVKEVEGEIVGPLQQTEKIQKDYINLFLYY